MEQELPRTAVINENVSELLSKLLDEAESWVMPDGERAPRWEELRAAILDKVFKIEREFGRQERFDDNPPPEDLKAADEREGWGLNGRIFNDFGNFPKEFGRPGITDLRGNEALEKELVEVLKEPNKTGFYWYRLDDQHVWSTMKVSLDEARRLRCSNFTDEGNFPQNYPGEWLYIRRPNIDSTEFHGIDGE